MFDRNKKHKINLEQDFVAGDMEFCVANNKDCFFIIPNRRGKKSKFWIKDNEGKNRYLLKYESRNNESLENVGQFIMCGVLDQLGVSYADYLVVDFFKDGRKHDAIMSKSYIENLNDNVEISGFVLNSKNRDRFYDNAEGMIAEYHHNVDFYVDTLKFLYSKNEVDFDNIRTTLVKYALLQYVYVMSDLHFYNLSFSYNESKGHKSLKVNPFYDCGNICTLNLSHRKVKNNAAQLKKTGKKKPFVENLIYKKMPMFGIKSDLCKIFREPRGEMLICRPICDEYVDKEKIPVAKECLERLRHELACEIIENDEMERFYNMIRYNVNLDKVAEHYNDIEKETIPDYCLELVKGISEVNIAELDKVILSQRKAKFSEEMAESLPKTEKIIEKV